VGHTVQEWAERIASNLNDVPRMDVPQELIVPAGVRPALAQFSIDRPREVIEEQAGTGSPYLSLPASWSAGFSTVLGIECPARQTPPVLLDAKSWMLTRSTSDVTAEKILLDRTPSASQYVRIRFSAPWPEPTMTATVDKIDDVSYSAVTALATSFLLLHLAAKAVRARQGPMSSNYPDGNDRGTNLREIADRWRAVYDAYLGRSTANDQGGVIGPASASFDFDPAAWSLFHGGRR